ncbi:hypothetical protein CCAX7_36630 [Capsulimonas corticalis]|uniref:Uncharacterized protein n=1 Tax=Capsulimonas corticalis TaxID=2219043 RepID=A0A402D1B9_9BACT|nr:hypothetical protein CCAX7_36630 [Capsulimonas corticalis]
MTPDVERGGVGVTDKVGGSRDAEKAKGKPAHYRVGSTVVITVADGGEELIRGKFEAANEVDLVNENGQRTFDMGETDFRNSMREAVERTMPLVFGPIAIHLILHRELMTYLRNETKVPLFD